MKKNLLIIVCWMFSSFASAAYVDGTGWMTISKINASDLVRFEVAGGTLCQTNVFLIDTRDQGGKEQYSLLLAAAASGKKIWLGTWVGCPSTTDPSQNWGMKVGLISVQY